jgi:hypothetical protein
MAQNEIIAMKLFFPFVFVVVFYLPLLAQEPDSTNTSRQNTQASESKPQGQYLFAFVDEHGDTIPQVTMNPYYVWARRSFKSKKEEKKYNKLERNVKVVYPYAKKASQLLAKYEAELDTVTDKRIRKSYYKKVEKELWAEYGDDIEDMTMSQGRILIKLIDRETDRTSYELVKDLRSGFTAFVFQGMAKLFGQDLKSEYNASEEDKYIEEIVLAIEQNRY